MTAPTLSPRARARRVRYAITLALRDAERAMSIAEICQALDASGVPLGDSPNKLVSDALRWEIRNGRATRAGWGKYAFVRMPKSTEWWMRQEAARVRSDNFATTLDRQPAGLELTADEFAPTLNEYPATAAWLAARRCRAMVDVTRLDNGAGEVCAAILATLPNWFGIPEANADYVAAADAHPSFVALDGDAAVGLTTITRYGDYSAEVHFMAVLPERHRHGIGRQMLRAAEDWLRGLGVEYLQVKTLSASAPDEGYAKTRAFYHGVGFRDLEEFPLLWDPSNPALQMIKRIEPL